MAKSPPCMLVNVCSLWMASIHMKKELPKIEPLSHQMEKCSTSKKTPTKNAEYCAGRRWRSIKPKNTHKKFKSHLIMLGIENLKSGTIYSFCYILPTLSSQSLSVKCYAWYKIDEMSLCYAAGAGSPVSSKKRTHLFRFRANVYVKLRDLLILNHKPTQWEIVPPFSNFLALDFKIVCRMHR